MTAVRVLGRDDRPTRLVVALLASLGYRDVEGVRAPPERGLLVVPHREAEAVDAARWVEGSEERYALVEPAGGEPIPLPGAPRSLGQRRTAPASQPKDGDAYLSDVAAIALAGYEARLRHGRPFPDEWRAEAASAVAELERKAVEPAGLQSLRAALGPVGESAPPPPGADGAVDAARRAAGGDSDAWRALLELLDERRGLFRRSADASAGVWHLHPALVRAVALRLESFAPPPAPPVVYGEQARGAAEGPWLDEQQSRCFVLRASVLSAAAAELDPPSLSYPYDFSDDAAAPPAGDALDTLPEALRPPARAELILCLRHDVDRPLSDQDVRTHLELEDRLGLASTWYFKHETFDDGLAAKLRDAGREIGWHAELSSTGDDGFAERLRAWNGGALGVTFHGGLGSEGWRGRRTFEDVLRAGARYAELPMGVRPRPVLWPADDGRVLPLAPLAVKPDVFPKRVETHVAAVAKPGSVVVVENHPDRLDDRYASLLERLASRGVTARTVGAALDAEL